MEHEYEILIQSISPKRFLDAVVKASRKYGAEIAQTGMPRLVKPYRLRLEFKDTRVLGTIENPTEGYTVRCVRQFYTKPELNKMGIREIQEAGRVWGVTGREVMQLANEIFECQEVYLGKAKPKAKDKEATKVAEPEKKGTTESSVPAKVAEPAEVSHSNTAEKLADELKPAFEGEVGNEKPKAKPKAKKATSKK